MRILFSVLLLFAADYYSQSFIWTRDYKTNYYTYGTQVLVDPQDNTYVVSEYDYSNQSGSFSVHGCVLRKYDKSGNLQWNIEKEGDVLNWHVALDQNGQLMLFERNGGIYKIGVDTQNGLLLQKQLVVPALALFKTVEYDKSGNFFITGIFMDSLVLCNKTHIELANALANSLFVAKFEPDGNCLWSNVSSGTAYFAWSAIDPFGNTFMTGSFSGSLSLGKHSIKADTYYPGFLAKIDPSGEVLWLKRVCDPYSPPTHMITVDLDGNVFLGGGYNKPLVAAGSTLIPTPGNFDSFIMKLDNEGSPLWVKRTGSKQIAGLGGIFTDNKDILIAGGFSGDTTFVDTPFLTRMDSEGNVLRNMKIECGGDGKGYGISVDKNNGHLYVAGAFEGDVYFGESSPHTGSGNMFVSKIEVGETVGLSEHNFTATTPYVFPNPASDMIALQNIPGGEMHVVIINSIGQTVKNLKCDLTKEQIDINELPSGIYILNATQHHQAYRMKFVK